MAQQAEESDQQQWSGKTMSLHTHGEQKHMASASTPQEEKEKVL
jgi:hypothetical protein